MNFAKRAFVITTLAMLLLAGLCLTAVELSAGWLNDQCQKLYKELAGGGNAMKASRPPIERMTKMYALIRSGKKLNAFDFAAMFEVSHKTIERDLEFMRDRIGLPVFYEASERVWKTDPSIRLPWWLERNNALTLL